MVSLQILKKKKTGHLGYLGRFDIFFMSNYEKEPTGFMRPLFLVMFWKSAGGWKRKKKKSTCCSLENTCKQIKKSIYEKQEMHRKKAHILFNVMSKREIKGGGTKMFSLIVHWKSRSLLICYYLTLQENASGLILP